MFDAHNRVLLIKRGHEPAMGMWSVPGGSNEPGETLEETALREIKEETGLDVVIGNEVWVATVALSKDSDYEIHAFAADITGGELAAGDDAADVRWVSWEGFMELETTPRLGELLVQAGWGP
jgi:acetyl-CoA carboxylase carboxyl transferase subunit beta